MAFGIGCGVLNRTPLCRPTAVQCAGAATATLADGMLGQSLLRRKLKLTQGLYQPQQRWPRAEGLALKVAVPLLGVVLGAGQGLTGRALWAGALAKGKQT